MNVYWRRLDACNLCPTPTIVTTLVPSPDPIPAACAGVGVAAEERAAGDRREVRKAAGAQASGQARDHARQAEEGRSLDQPKGICLCLRFLLCVLCCVVRRFKYLSDADCFCIYLYLSPSLSVCGCQDCEINRLRAKLKRDSEAHSQELKNSAVELDEANAQAQLHREQAEDLRREKSDLQKEMAATLKQKAVEVNTGHVWCRAQGTRLR